MSKNIKVDNTVDDFKEGTTSQLESYSKGGDYSNKIKNFGGEEAQFPEFLERFIMLSNAFDWDDKITAKRFPLHLCGLALDFYFELTDAVKGKWDDLKNAFKKKYINPESSKLFGREFRTRKQLLNEEVETYAHDLKKLAKMAYPLFTPQQIDAVLTDQFLLGLNRELQSALIDKDFDTFDGAVSKARSMEYRRKLFALATPKESLIIIKEPMNRNSPPTLNFNRETLNNNGDYFCSFCKRYGHLLKSCRRLAEKREGEFRRNNSANIVCYRCGMKGHRREQCREQVRSMPDQGKRIMTCYKCGKEGHMARECRNGEAVREKMSEANKANGWNAKGWASKNNFMIREQAVEEIPTQSNIRDTEMAELKSQNARLLACCGDHRIGICVRKHKKNRETQETSQQEQRIQSPLIIDCDEERLSIFEVLEKAMRIGEVETRQSSFLVADFGKAADSADMFQGEIPKFPLINDKVVYGPSYKDSTNSLVMQDKHIANWNVKCDCLIGVYNSFCEGEGLCKCSYRGSAAFYRDESSTISRFSHAKARLPNRGL